MSLRGSSVLVTGGAGFVGSHLVDRIIEEKPRTVIAIDNLYLGRSSNLEQARAYPGFKEVTGDASKMEVLEKLIRDEGVEYIFNLATIPLTASYQDPQLTVRNNIEGVLSLLELQRKGAYKRLIHFSAAGVYGSARYTPMDEAHPLQPPNPYYASKAASDLLIHSWGQSFGTKVAVIRMFNIYGPRQNEKLYAGIIPVTICRTLDGLPPIIAGTGRQKRDFLYVRDAVDACVKIANRESTYGRVINLGSGTEDTILNIVKMICELTGYKGKFEKKEARKADISRHLADISLAKKLIGFKPKTPLKEGLRETVEWYRTHRVK